MAGIPIYGTYAFADVYATISGPGGNVSLNGYNTAIIAGPDTASAEEGITVALGEETNTQTIGADGSVMNSLHSSRAGTATIRLLKISPINKMLLEMYNYQRLSSARWAHNTIEIHDVGRGDHYTLLGCAFVRFPTNSYAKVGGVIEWEFHVSLTNPLMGAGHVFTQSTAVGGQEIGAPGLGEIPIPPVP